MPGTMYVLSGEQLQPMTETAYDSEALLQRFLASYPDLLGGDQMNLDNPRRLLLVRREMEVADREEGARRWALDHLFLDQEGVPTLVEVKRASNTQLRREVVAQMLDYAANAVVYWPVDMIRSSFEETWRIAGRLPSEVLADFLRLEQLDEDETDEIGLEEFWGRVKTNLEAERIRLVFVADEIPASLQRIVEFLNGQMNPAEVVAVEVKQFVGGNLRTLVPRVVGQTAKAQTAKGGARTPRGRRWDEASFFDVLDQTGDPGATRVVRSVLEWARSTSLTIRWLSRSASAFVVVFSHGARHYDLFRVKPENLVVLFHRHAVHPPFDAPEQRVALASRLNAIPGVSVDGTKWKQSILLSALSAEGASERFFRIFEWFIEEVRLLQASTTDF